MAVCYPVEGAPAIRPFDGAQLAQTAAQEYGRELIAADIRNAEPKQLAANSGNSFIPEPADNIRNADDPQTNNMDLVLPVADGPFRR